MTEGPIRVYELAKEFNMPSKDLVDRLREMKIDIRNHMSTLNDNAVQLARARFQPKPEKPSEELQKDFEKEQEAEAAKTTGRKSRISAKEKRKIGAIGKAKALEDLSEEEAAPEAPRVHLHANITLGELAGRLKASPQDLIKEVMQLGSMATINQRLDLTVAEALAEAHGYVVEKVELDEKSASLLSQGGKSPAAEQSRSPVVTVMGHVDHGKTSLLDALRKSNVAAGEKGAITQHIGAYKVSTPEGDIVFLDTPGHEAFSAMRARGAKVTDLVVLVVAANDGVMPQTEEALDHAKDANVPILVALNKIDLPEANPDRVKQQLAEKGLNPVEYGGTTEVVPLSAKSGKGLDKLLEIIHLQAQMLELKARPQGQAQGVVLESSLERGRGPVATVLVRQGQLKTGDCFVAGNACGRVRLILDDRGRQLKEAGPSTPVLVSGLEEVVEAGDEFVVVDDIRTAKRLSEEKRQLVQRSALGGGPARMTLESYQQMIQQGDVKELKVILKADVHGSVEALADSVAKLGNDKAKVSVVRKGLGPVNQADVMLAAASKAVIVGFGTGAEPDARKEAERRGVEIRSYDIIYKALEEIGASLAGLLSPTLHEEESGRLDVRKVFPTPRGPIAGCMVKSGRVQRGQKARVFRKGEPVHEGDVDSLRRFKDDVKEVASGFECGVGVGFAGIQEGDEIVVLTVTEVAAKL